jgi:bacterial/archaeal transporter family-2 protein
MSSALSAALFVLIAGLVVAVQSPLFAVLSSRLGLLGSALVVNLGGTIVSGVLLVILGGGTFGKWASVPWYAWCSGALGVIVISSVGFAVPRIGAVGTSVGIIVGQLILAALIDHFGWFGVTVRALDWVRIAGLVLLLLGAWLVIRPAA